MSVVSEQTDRTFGATVLDDLIETLRRRGYRVIGPQARDGAIVYDDLDSADELPAGWRDVQAPGSYRLERRSDDARFGYAVGPASWKRFLFPPRVRLWHATGIDAVDEETHDERPLAFVGVRPCELRAIEIQDRVFVGGPHVDADYSARRRGLFTVAVNCHDPSSACFCTSVGTGPAAGPGYDLLLDELLDGRHRFLARAGSAAGAEVLAELETCAATDEDRNEASEALTAAEEQISRTLEPDARDVLLRNLESPRWDDVAERCLTCGNCTLVCPTCFCSGIEDTTDLADGAERWRTWDSCFSLQYSHIAGAGPARPTASSRYRQWLVHKLATWPDQFGIQGCVGCGRCISWCPVGIDITEEVAAIKQAEKTEAVT